MDLLFTESDFSDELRKLLGFVDADISMDSVRSELLTATREMKSYVGAETYKRFVDLYRSDSYESEDVEALHLVRYPIAMNTYRLAAPSLDLQHTTSGRLMRTDEHQKSPFAWMIDRNNEVNERKYYRGLDDLLEYLFNDEDFKKTENFRKFKKLFISETRDFEEYYPIESRFLLVKLSPGIKQCMRDFIAPRLGQDKYLQLKTDHESEQGVTDADKELFELVKEACVYHSLQWAMSRLSVNLLPEGLLQQYAGDRNNTRASKTPEGLQTQLAAQKFAEDTARALLAIENYVSKNNEVEMPQEREFNDFRDDDLFATT